MKEQILKLYNQAETDKIIGGLTWYEKAHNECLLLSQVFELPLNKVVGIVSALSVNNKWRNNLKDAWNFLDKPSLKTKVSTYKVQRQKALDILNSDGSEKSILKILKGEKTTKFFKNIKHYKTSTAVTVDTWAYRSVNASPTKKNYKLVEQAYQDVAYGLGILPHQVQAVVWGVVRGGLI